MAIQGWIVNRLDKLPHAVDAGSQNRPSRNRARGALSLHRCYGWNNSNWLPPRITGGQRPEKWQEPAEMSGFLQAQTRTIQTVTTGDGFQTLDDLKTRGSRKRPDPAVACMDRQRLAVGEGIQQPIEHPLVLDVPPQRPDHRWSEKEDAGGNPAHADAGQCLTERFQAVRAVGQAGQNWIEPRFDGDMCADQVGRLRDRTSGIAAPGSNAATVPGSSEISPIRPWTSGA